MRIKDLWLHYEDRGSPEARLVHDVDKLDPCVQGTYYGRMGHYVRDFFPHARQRVLSTRFLPIIDVLETFPEQDVHPYEEYFSLLQQLLPEKQ